MNMTTSIIKNDPKMKLLGEHQNALDKMSKTLRGFIDYDKDISLYS
jgi:hypothetical protein